MKIFITGQARSGTTLLRNLFTAFEDMDVQKDEASIDTLVQAESNGHIVVKRCMGSILSHCMVKPKEVERQWRLILEHDVKLIHIQRDRYDLAKSWQDAWGMGEQGFFEWGLIENTIDWYKPYYLRYEDLVSEPNYEQEVLASWLGLTIKHKWSDYPKFVPKEFDAKGKYKLRPLCAE